jgi:dTDP-4-dehydrorhamnose reductase
MRIALIGADGQLGSELVTTLVAHEVCPLYYPDFDITQPDSARDRLARLHPDVVINTAAFNRVDECEERPCEPFLVNAVAVRDLAAICHKSGSILVHFSSDYVFDGKKRTPYTEDDEPNPLSIYGLSKLAGEIFIRNIMERYFIIRTCGLYGESLGKDKGPNFVDIMLNLERTGKAIRVVHDQRVTPTSAAELAGQVAELIMTPRFGLYHMTNEGECTWYEFAAAIFALLGRNPLLVPVDSKSYGARAPRPAYSVLENQRAKQAGLTGFSHWRKALADFLVKKGHTLKA